MKKIVIPGRFRCQVVSQTIARTLEEWVYTSYIGETVTIPTTGARFNGIKLSTCMIYLGTMKSMQSIIQSFNKRLGVTWIYKFQCPMGIADSAMLNNPSIPTQTWIWTRPQTTRMAFFGKKSRGLKVRSTLRESTVVNSCGL